jgi:CheY-like chemotaxis protein
VPRILVADDNTNIQRMVVLAFQERGLEVITVGNGEAAVRRLPEADPDVVLADVFMPVRNGYEVCEFVKKDARFCHIPVILLVGAFDPMDEKEARRVGADGVLKKPFVPPDPLIAMVMAALEKNPRVVAEMAKAKEAALAAAALAAAKPEIPAMAEPKPLPEFPEPTPEEAAVIYGFGKGMRALDSDDEIEETSQASAKTKEAPAPKEPVKSVRAPRGSSPSITPVVDEDDNDSEAFDESATASDWRRNAGDIEVPENVAADPIYSYGRNFEPITFPSEQKAPPKHMRVDVNVSDEVNAADASNIQAVESAAVPDSVTEGAVEAAAQISADNGPAAAASTTDATQVSADAATQAAGARAEDSSSRDADASAESKVDDWEIECLPVGETATETFTAAKDQVVESKSAEVESRAPARFFTESELTEVEASQSIGQAEENQPSIAAQSDTELEEERNPTESPLAEVQQLSVSEPAVRVEDVGQSRASETVADNDHAPTAQAETTEQPAAFRHVPRVEELEPSATPPSVTQTEEDHRADRSRFVGTVDELRHLSRAESAKKVERPQRPVASLPAARVEEPEQAPARTGFVAKVRSWMDMMSPLRVQEADDHWTAKLKTQPTQQHTDTPGRTQSPTEHSEVEELAKRDAEILAFKRDDSAKKSETPRSQAVTPSARNQTRAESTASAMEQLRTLDRDASASKFEAVDAGASHESREEARAGADAQAANADADTRANADAPRVELPVDSLAQVSSFEPEKEPVAGRISTFSSQLLFAPADTPHNGDFSAEHPRAEPLLLDEEHHEPSDSFSQPEEAREVENREEESHAEPAQPEPSEPFSPVSGADYWNHEPDVNQEPFAANVPGPLFDSAFASSDVYDFDGRMPTLPPPNREALADIPFLMPPLPLTQAAMPSRAASGDTAIVDAVVQKVLERLQPGLRELLAESMKPLVENMLLEELHKKEK